jgi:hypothetical protein
VWTTADTFTIAATIEEDSNYLAVKWTWTDGLPSELGESFTRCTNGVCDEDYRAWITDDAPFEFVGFVNPPAGEYTMTVEAMDARGHYVCKEITFRVIESDEPSNTGMPGEDSGALETGPGWTSSGGGDETGTESGDVDGDEGCGCRAAPGGGLPRRFGGVLWLLLVVSARRSRRG